MSAPISVEQYRELILAGVEPLPVRLLPLADCLGLEADAPIAAKVGVPVFTNSAMDGFAVLAGDVASATGDQPVRLKVIGEVPAGAASDLPVGAGQAMRIMTGAPLPGGADAVVPVELTDQRPGAAPLPADVRVYVPVAEGANIRLTGEDLREGDRVLEAGTRLDATCLAAAAATGHGSLPVRPRPRVAIIATGAELVAPGEPLGHGQIHDSNSLLLHGLAVQAGADAVSVTRCSDDPDAFDEAVAAAVAGADLVVTTGGVSAGTHDVVKNSAVAATLHFTKVAMQPGKPQGFGHLTSPDGRRVPLLALPGNPVSVFVSWHCYAVPLLARLGGHEVAQTLRTATMTAGKGWSSPAGRRQYIPVARTDDRTVVPAHELGSGSHLIASLHLAEGLAVIPAETTWVGAGDPVEVLWTRSIS